MKRAALLFCSGIDAARFKLLKQRDQLPFHVLDHDHDAKWADYSLEQAFRLRVMLDLMDDGNKETYPAGLGPQFARSIAENLGVTREEALGANPAHWAGVIGVQGATLRGEGERWLLRFAGPLSNLETAIAVERERCAEAYSGISVRRMFLADATRAARYVTKSAKALGIFKGDIPKAIS